MQLEEKNKQLELEHQIMEKKIHLEVSELETKLKDAHVIIEIEDSKKNLENWRKCWNIQRKDATGKWAQRNADQKVWVELAMCRVL